ncbi:MAG: glycosyl hydrolase family 8 [Chloroflexota bacterium]|nr:glycosyl hydrolase family 8 [Chloroflexota bacterium]
MPPDDRWDEIGQLTRRGLLALGAASLLAIDDAEARKHKKKKRRHKRKKRGKGESGNTPGPVLRVQRPFPQHLDYGEVRPSRWTQAQLDNAVRTFYDRWKSRYLVALTGNDGNQQYRVAFGRSREKRKITVSEGQGYGLVIAASMAGHDPNAQRICEGLWRFARAHPSDIDNRLMDWRVPGGDGDDSAFDGDADLAYGLLLADAQWGSGGAINFRAEFDRTLAGILASTIGPQSRLPMLGDWVKPNDGTYNQYTPRSSDLMTGHFRTWARATGANVWNDVVARSQSTITTMQANYAPNTGLLPDFIQPRSAADHDPRPADAKFLEGPNDGSYSYNAGRDPWRIGADALLHGDPTSAAQAAKIARWANAATSGYPRAFRSGYTLSGMPLPDSDYFSIFFAAPLGVAAMCDPGLQTWLDDIYAAVIATTNEDYYEESVALLCLLLMTGNFRDPTR